VVKDYVAAKIAKKEARKERQRQEALEAARKRRAEIKRDRYEDVVNEFRRRPWHLLQIPDGILSPREEETLSWLARGLSDELIAQKMNLKLDSIRPRLCAARKKLGIVDDDGLIQFYQAYRAERVEMRNAKIWTVIGMLLNPPPGERWQRDYPFRFERRLGKSKKLEYRVSGVAVADRVFDCLTPYRHNVMLLKSKGLSNEEIAQRLKIKASTIPGYISSVRSHVRWKTGTWIKSEADLCALYAAYAARSKRKIIVAR
jgi:DNA-binding NarL/FixJ family response regulator